LLALSIPELSGLGMGVAIIIEAPSPGSTSRSRFIPSFLTGGFTSMARIFPTVFLTFVLPFIREVTSTPAFITLNGGRIWSSGVLYSSVPLFVHFHPCTFFLFFFLLCIQLHYLGGILVSIRFSGGFTLRLFRCRALVRSWTRARIFLQR
jgi:hypothetical protein